MTQDIQTLTAGDGLLPCPFCGKTPDLHDYTLKSAGAWVIVHRENCAAHQVSSHPTKASALKLWNRRAALLNEPIGWIYEDTLCQNYPYDVMFKYSEVRDGVRMFPVYARAALNQGQS